jgi:DNA polymerase (family 10)
VSTIGDIDIAIVTKNPKESIKYFCTYPHDEIIEQGPTGASIRLHNGRQVDLRVQDKASYGAMLQYFTGSKNHNIALRSYALTKHVSLSEYGIKKVSRESSFQLGSGQEASKSQKKEKIKQFKSEKEFYAYLGMDWIPPELREGRGEVERALSHTLPNLVELSDMKGDLHLHTSYDLEPSHDLGANTLHELLDQAAILNYDYIGISDHNPSVGNHTDSEIVEIMKKRQVYYKEQCRTWNAQNKKDIRVFVMLEVDIKPDGTLALPLQAFDFVDAVIVSVHSSFTLDREVMTQRIITALTTHPKVKVFGHPTGRLINKRESYEAHWDQIFDTVKNHDIALEINASPYRLDLSDALVYEALKKQCKFVIDTDAHQRSDMNGMKYGVSVARRGWAEKRDILNTYSYNDMKKWLMP